MCSLPRKIFPSNNRQNLLSVIITLSRLNWKTIVNNPTSKPISVFKTYKFKIHSPSSKKKAAIDKSCKQATALFYKLVAIAKPSTQQLLVEIKIVDDKIKELEQSQLTEKDRKAEIKALTKTKRDLKNEHLKSITKLMTNYNRQIPYGSSIKDGVVIDAVAQVSSYMELLEIGQDAALPTRNDYDVDYNEALNDLLSSTTLELENQAKDRLCKLKNHSQRPITLSRYRETMILLDDQNRLFAFPLLWSAKDKRSKPIAINATDTRTGEAYKKTSAQGCILFLECSQWQIDALKNGTAKTSKLYKQGDDYFLAVAVEFLAPRREPTTIIGIDRGICEIATYAVRDITGKVIAKGTFNGEALRSHQRKCEKKQKDNQKLGKALITSWSNYADNLLHNISKQIVDVADQYNAQVVIEDLKAISNGHHHKRQKFARKTNFNRMLSRQQYGKLESMLDYKLQAVGLPKPQKVHPAFTSTTCPKCGYSGADNRLKDTEEHRAIFNCVNCKFKEHSDIIGAINIAGKRIWLNSIGSKLKKGKSLAGELKFNNWQANNLTL